MAESKKNKEKELIPDPDAALESFLGRNQEDDSEKSSKKEKESDLVKEAGEDSPKDDASGKNGKSEKKKGKKINKTVIIIIVAVVVVAALVLLLILTRNHTAKGSDENDTYKPAEVSLDVDANGEHIAQIAVDEDGNIKENGTGNLLNYVPADISRIDVENTKGSFSVTSHTPEGEATIYTLVGFEDCDLEEGIADEIATDSAAITFNQIVAVDGNPADFGLDEPRAKVKVTYNDKTTAAIRVGNEAPSGAGTYIGFGSSDAVYLVANESVDSFMYNVNDFISREITAASDSSDYSTFNTMTVSGSRYDEPITLVPNKDEAIDSVYIVTEPRRMYANAVESYDIAGAVRGLYADEVVCVNPSGDQMKSYGLDEPYAKVVAVYPDVEITLMASSADDNGNAYVYNPDKDIIYSTQFANLSWAKTSVEALEPQYILSVKIESVKNIEFTAGDESYSIDCSTTTELQDDEEGNTQDVQVTKATCDGKNLKQDDFKVFFQNLTGIENAGDIGSGGDEILRFTYTYNTDRDPDTITVYSTGSAKYAVALNGEITGSASKSYIDSLIENPAALLKGEPVNNL